MQQNSCRIRHWSYAICILNAADLFFLDLKSPWTLILRDGIHVLSGLEFTLRMAVALSQLFDGGQLNQKTFFAKRGKIFSS